MHGLHVRTGQISESSIVLGAGWPFLQMAHCVSRGQLIIWGHGIHFCWAQPPIMSDGMTTRTPVSHGRMTGRHRIGGIGLIMVVDVDVCADVRSI